MGLNGTQQGFSNTMADDAGFPSSGVSNAAKGLLPQQQGQPSLPAQRAQLPGAHIPPSMTGGTSQGAFQPVVGGPAQGSQFRTPPTTLSSGAQSALRAYSITSANQAATPKPNPMPGFQPTPPPAVAGVPRAPLMPSMPQQNQMQHGEHVSGFLGNALPPSASLGTFTTPHVAFGQNQPHNITGAGPGQQPTPAPEKPPIVNFTDENGQVYQQGSSEYAGANVTPLQWAKAPAGYENHKPGVPWTAEDGNTYTVINGGPNNGKILVTDSAGHVPYIIGVGTVNSDNATTGTPSPTQGPHVPSAQELAIQTTQNAYKTGGAYDTWMNQGIQDKLGMAQRAAAAQAGEAGYGFNGAASAPALQAQAAAQGAQLQERGQLEQMQQSANQQAFAMRLQQAGFDQQTIANLVAQMQASGQEPDAATLNNLYSQFGGLGNTSGVQGAVQQGVVGSPEQAQAAFVGHEKAIKQYLLVQGGPFDIGNKRSQIIGIVNQMSPEERKLLKNSGTDKQIRAYLGDSNEGDQYNQTMSGVY